MGNFLREKGILPEVKVAMLAKHDTNWPQL
jgi:hypothetical protein